MIFKLFLLFMLNSLLPALYFTDRIEQRRENLQVPIIVCFDLVAKSCPALLQPHGLQAL